MSATYEQLQQALAESDAKWNASTEELRAELAQMKGQLLAALVKIAEADPVELAKYPLWAQRIARDALDRPA
jgi:uncharacterized protein YeaO (DUF488 family)